MRDYDMPLPSPANATRLTGSISETMVSTVRCVLYAIIPDAASVDVITVKNTATIGAGTAVSISAPGLPQTGKQFGPYGILCDKGLSITLAGADTVTVIWAPI